jgi:hypothetical protein
VYGETQAVGPVQPTPPHCPYSDCVPPPELVVLDVAGAEEVVVVEVPPPPPPPLDPGGVKVELIGPTLIFE